METTRAERKTMTPDEARSFDSFSIGNAAVVVNCFACGCKPYEDVFTYRRWLAQGFQVKRGEHGVKLAKVSVIDRENKETGEVERHFCRHQVEVQA